MRVYAAVLLFLLGIPARAQERPADCRPSTIECLTWRSQMADPSADYDDTLRKAMAYFAAHPEKTREADGEWIAFLRWRWIAGPRISIDSKGRKNLLAALQTMQELSQSSIGRKTTQGTAQSVSICSTTGSIPSDWDPLGPSNLPVTAPGATVSPNGLGIVTAVEVDLADPSHHTIYAGTARSGLWVTFNGGFTWNYITPQIPGMGIVDIALGPGTIYITTGSGLTFPPYSYGLYKSTDGGQTWSQTGPALSTAILQTFGPVAVDPHTGDVFTFVNQNAYRSTNGGATWTQNVVPGAASDEYVRDIEFHPTLPGIVYIASIRRNSSAAHAWRSTNSGGSWTTILTASERIELAVSPKDPNSLWALHATNVNSSPSVLEHSGNCNSTCTWDPPKPTTSFISDGWTNNLQVSPVDTNILYAATLQTFKSTNGGTSWTSVTTKSVPSARFQHDDTRALVIVKGTLGGANDRVITGNDGGVNQTTTGGSTWSDITGGMNITQFYGLGGTEMSPSLVFGGTQDTSSDFYDGLAWHNTSTEHCDGGDGIIDPTNPARLYALCNGSLMRSTNSGASWTGISPPASVPTIDIPITLDPANPQTIYAGYDAVWRSNNQGTTWTQLSPSLPGSVMTAIAVAPSNPNVIYAARDLITWGQPVGQIGALIVSYDGGQTWTDRSPALSFFLQWVGITDIVVDPKHPFHVWASFTGFDAPRRVAYSTDGGATWTSMASTGLPGLPVNKLLYERCTNDRIYAATDAGIYLWNGASWDCWSDGLPTAIVTDLEANYTGGTIRAATMGRGIWESPLPFGATANCTCVPPPAPPALWTPLDEPAGSAVMNIGGTNGVANGPTPASGQIAGARCFSGTAAIDIPNYADANVAAGHFTVDAWIKPTAISGNQVIVDKRTSTRGYALYLAGGFPSLFMADNTGISSFSANAPIPVDGAFHHVAVTVRRPISPLGTFYIDGTPAGTFNPTRNNSLSSAAIVRIGGRANPAGEFFQGCIDEAEIFRDVLSAADIQAIAMARAGKCKSYCTTKGTGFCLNSSTTTANHRICNNTLQPQTLQYLFTSVPANGTSCTLSGPLTFTPASGNITISPGQCQNVTVTIAKPAWLTSSGTACYQMIVNGATDSFICPNSLQDWSGTCSGSSGSQTPNPN